MNLVVEFEQEEDGHWIAEIPVLPGAMAYGASKKEALKRVASLALRIVADRIEHGEEIPAPFNEIFAVPIVDMVPAKGAENIKPTLGTGIGKVKINDPDWWRPMTDKEVDAFLEGRY